MTHGFLKAGACLLRYMAVTSEGGVTRSQDPTRTAEVATALLAGTLGQTLLSAPTESFTAEAGVEGAVSVVLAAPEEPGLVIREEDSTRVFLLVGAPHWTIGRCDR